VTNVELIASQQRERESRRIGTACFIHSDLVFATAANLNGAIGHTIAEAAHD
jgi:hypothetical protein